MLLSGEVLPDSAPTAFQNDLSYLALPHGPSFWNTLFLAVCMAGSFRSQLTCHLLRESLFSPAPPPQVTVAPPAPESFQITLWLYPWWLELCPTHSRCLINAYLLDDWSGEEVQLPGYPWATHVPSQSSVSLELGPCGLYKGRFWASRPQEFRAGQGSWGDALAQGKSVGRGLTLSYRKGRVPGWRRNYLGRVPEA